MADAKKCDICGKYFVLRTTPVWGTLQDNIRDNAGGSGTKKTDMCPECLTAIKDHIKWLQIKDVEEPEKPKENPHRCDTCLYQDSGSVQCMTCISDNSPENRLTHIPSNWQSKEGRVHEVADNKESLHTCDRCKYAHQAAHERPCYLCLRSSRHIYWEKKED